MKSVKNYKEMIEIKTFILPYCIQFKLFQLILSNYWSSGYCGPMGIVQKQQQQVICVGKNMLSFDRNNYKLTCINSSIESV